MAPSSCGRPLSCVTPATVVVSAEGSPQAAARVMMGSQYRIVVSPMCRVGVAAYVERCAIFVSARTRKMPGCGADYRVSVPEERPARLRRGARRPRAAEPGGVFLEERIPTAHGDPGEIDRD